MDPTTPIAPELAFDCLSNLQQQYSSSGLHHIYLRSVADTAHAFTEKPSFLKRFFLRTIYKHKKIPISVGNKTLQLTITPYDNQSNLSALRQLFHQALLSKKIHIGSESKAIVSFVLDLERRLGTSDEPHSCLDILEEYFFKQIQSAQDLQTIRDICGQAETKELFACRKEHLILPLLDKIPESKFANKMELLGTIYELMDLDEEGRQTFERLVLALISPTIASKTSPETVAKLTLDVTILRKRGMKLADADAIFSSHTDALEKQWVQKEQALIEKLATVTEETFSETMKQINEEWQRYIQEDQTKLCSSLQNVSAETKDFILRRCLQGQIRLTIDLSAKSIDKSISLISEKTLSDDEKRSVLRWMQSMLADLNVLQNSPQAAHTETMSNVIVNLRGAIASLSKTIPPQPSKPSQILSILEKTALKVGQVSKGVFYSLPFLLTFAAPAMVSSISGYNAGGLAGMLLSGATAIATSTLARASSLFSGYISSKVADFYFLPGPLKKVVQTSVGIVSQILLMNIALQANSMIAGGILSMAKPLNPPQPIPKTHIPPVPTQEEDKGWTGGVLSAVNPLAFIEESRSFQWIKAKWNDFLVYEEKVETAGGFLAKEVGKVSGSGGTYANEEWHLFKAVWVAPDSGWPIVGRIKNIFSHQVTAGEAGFHFGESVVRSMKATGHFFKVLFGFSSETSPLGTTTRR